MSSPTVARTWRKRLADLYEQECGLCLAFIKIAFAANKSLLQPLPDPVPTFGADLISAPSTPVLSASMAGPNIDFLEKLDQSLNIAFATPISDYQNDSESSSDDENYAPWSPRAHAAWFLKMAPASTIIRKDQKRKRSNEGEHQHLDQDTQSHKRLRRIAMSTTIFTKSEASFAQSERQTRSAKKHHSLCSPPQTPSSTAQASPKDRINPSQSKVS